MQLSSLKGNEMSIPVWKTVEIGNLGNSFAAMSRLLHGGPYIIWGAESCELVSYEKTSRGLDLVLVSPRELGITKQSSYVDLYREAEKLNLSLCPAETAISLMIQERELRIPKGRDYFFGGVCVAMEPIQYKDKNLLLHVGGNQISRRDILRFYESEDASLVFVRN